MKIRSRNDLRVFGAPITRIEEIVHGRVELSSIFFNVSVVCAPGSIPGPSSSPGEPSFVERSRDMQPLVPPSSELSPPGSLDSRRSGASQRCAASIFSQEEFNILTTVFNSHYGTLTSSESSNGVAIERRLDLMLIVSVLF